MFDEQSILGWINEQRAERGLGKINFIRKGRRQSPCDCPIARSLAANSNFLVRVGRATFIFSKRDSLDSWVRHTPAHIRSFINDFDNGSLPQYDTLYGSSA